MELTVAEIRLLIRVLEKTGLFRLLSFMNSEDMVDTLQLESKLRKAAKCES